MPEITVSTGLEPIVGLPPLVAMPPAEPRFAILSARRPRELARWLALWQAWPAREVFAHPHYVRLLATAGQEPLCACWQDAAHGCVLYPFLLRPLEREPFCEPALGPRADLVTPYGYGGPFSWAANTSKPLPEQFWSHFDAWAAQQGVVAEFIRFALPPAEMLPYPGTRRIDRPNVVCDLTCPEEVLWSNFRHKVRKNVHKAQRSGLRVEIDPTGEGLEAFLRIYEHTMQRREASASYYFGRSFFEKLHADLPGQFVYFHALQGERIVSSELVLVSAENVYSFLGGTESDAFELRPNDLLKFEILRWAQSQGKLRFVLGGGYQPNDGIFQYKQAFAPDGVVSFEVGHRILAPEAYAALVRARQAYATRQGQLWQPRDSYFPAYRS